MRRALRRSLLAGVAILGALGLFVPPASAATQSVTAVVASPLNGTPGVAVGVGFGTVLSHFTPQFIFTGAGHGCLLTLVGSFVLDDGAGNTLTASILDSPCFDSSLPIALPPISHFSLLVGQGTGTYAGVTGTGTYDGTFELAIAGLVQLTIQT